MRVLVTGGSSLLGGAVARRLVQRGDEVTCFQRSSTDTGAADVRGDVRDAKAVLRVAAGHDAVVHLAALVAPRPAWDNAYQVNVVGTRNVVSGPVWPTGAHLVPVGGLRRRSGGGGWCRARPLPGR